MPVTRWSTSSNRSLHICVSHPALIMWTQMHAELSNALGSKLVDCRLAWVLVLSKKHDSAMTKLEYWSVEV